MKKIWLIIGNIIFWFSWPVLYLFINKTERTRVIIICGEHMLMVKNWIGSSKWSLPGGGKHLGEDSKLAATREVKEETNLELDKSSLNLFIRELLIKEYGFKYKIDGYFVKLNTLSAVRSQSLEITDVSWLKWRELINTKQISRSTKLIIQTWIDSGHLVD